MDDERTRKLIDLAFRAIDALDETLTMLSEELKARIATEKSGPRLIAVKSEQAN